MVNVSARQVKELRDKTGAGMMDCKKALSETSGDLEAAVDWLRQQGLAAAAKKAGRLAAEGLVGIALADGRGAVVEVNSETDFVARNPGFQEFVRRVADLALEAEGDLPALLKSQARPGASETVEEETTRLIAEIGENLSLRRAGALAVKPGVVAGYVHNQAAPNLGRIGVLVALESEGDPQALAELGRRLAMHVAATSPLAVGIEDLDSEVVERERNILTEQAKASGKPEEIIAKMVEGRLHKFYQETVFLEQVYVIDGETRVSKVLEETAKELGSPVRVAGILRFALGEGIKKEEKDFAAEVAAQVAG
jgi:elongation factor Ts